MRRSDSPTAHAARDQPLPHSQVLNQATVVHTRARFWFKAGPRSSDDPRGETRVKAVAEGRELLSSGAPRPAGVFQPTVTAILPRASPASMTRWASTISSKRNTRTGFAGKVPAATFA